jgi:hypothetical protein
MNCKKYFYIVSLCIFFCISCSKNQDKYKLPVVNINGVEVADLDPLKLTDTTNIKLSQIVDNIKVVTLQTTDESLIYATSIILVGNKYIFANRENEIYQFSITGEFIRLLVKKGRGPGEIPSRGNNIRCNINENMDLFFVSVANRIYLYKLSTGEYIGFKIQQNFGDYQEIRSITISADSMFIYSYSSRGGVPDDSLGCGIVIQDWNNNLIWHKRFNYKTWTVYPPPISYDLLHGSDISVVNTDDPKKFVIQVYNQDTSYLLGTDNFSLNPYLLLRTIGPLKSGYPIDYISVGSYRISQEFNSKNGYYFMSMDIITGLAYFPNSIDGYSYHIIYDDNKKLAYNIGPFENDYFGFTHTRSGPNKSMSIYPSFAAPYGKVVVTYEASEFLKLAKGKLKEPGLLKVIKDRLTELTNDLTEFSNPILVIGEMRKIIIIDQ